MLRTLPLMLLCFGALAQTVPATLQFDVASVNPSPRGEPGKPMRVGCNGGPGPKDPGLFTCQNLSVSNLVTLAYSMDFYRVAGLEGATQMMNISASVPEGTTKDQFSVMMQNLLADRFHLVAHHESREMAKYELVVAKNGPKFKKAAEAPPVNPDTSPKPPPGPSPLTTDQAGFPVLTPGRPDMAMTRGRARMFQPRMTMQRLAGQVSSQMGKPVTDATGLEGEYEIGLYWASDTRLSANPDANDPAETGPTLPQALQKQLGLRLEQKKGPVDFLVVDHIDKLPSDN